MLQDKSMLADLTIHRWTALKHDRAVSAQVEQSHGAKDAGRYNKQLIDKSYLAKIDESGNALRKYHNAHTLAWSDRGARLLPSKLFMDYRNGVADLKRQRRIAVDEFIAVYPQLVANARLRLNTMFQPEDYPHVEVLSKSFDVDLEIMPVPNSEDFRVSVAKETQDEIRQQIADSINSRQAGAVKECWSRVREVVTRISDQCGKENGRIHDSLISNAADLVNILDGLNITNDPELSAIGREIRDMLVSADQLRVNAVTRKRVAETADAILRKIQ